MNHALLLSKGELNLFSVRGNDCTYRYSTQQLSCRLDMNQHIGNT